MDEVQEVKDKLSLEDVISEYIQLKPAGRNYKGLSPFTNEKTPSFMVSPEKQIWHDFSSGKGGDIFTFIEEIESVDFKSALEQLAGKAGVDLESGKNRKKSGPSKERLMSAVSKAVKFYQVQMKHNRASQEYIFKKRGFDKPTVLDFGLGYSPTKPDALVSMLRNKGYSDYEIKLAGLSSSGGSIKNSGLTDMFRGRIMVPLMDSFGKPIGFTARLLEENKNFPKYINTPSTPLYDKSRHIFGLHLAKQAIKQNDYAVMVEGNLDVISSHQADIKNVVATAGTALTEYQLKSLGRLSPNVRLAFDQDRAGLAATERAIPLASKAKVNLSIITLPEGKDPDDLIRQDKKAFLDAIDDHQYALDWLIDKYQSKLDISTAAGKREFSDIILSVIKSLDDPVEKDHYIEKVAGIIKVSPESVRDKLTSRSEPKKFLKKPDVKIQQSSGRDIQDWQKLSDRLLALALMSPSTRGYLDLLEPVMLGSQSSKNVLEFIKSHPDSKDELSRAKQLQSEAQYVNILILLFEELYSEVDMLEQHSEAKRLRSRVVNYFVRFAKKSLTQKLSDNPDDQETLSQVRKLDQLLKAVN